MKDVPDLDVGAPGTIDALFCRDFVSEQVTPKHFANVPGAVTEPTTDKIIKSMINFELRGLMDCAVELAEHVNAAKNILRCGLTALAEGTSTSRLGSPGLQARE
jgi:hypothetical protein